MDKTDFYAHGKLLLTGEYFVLDGALALAVPTKAGQRFRVSEKAIDETAETVWKIHYPDNAPGRSILIDPDDWELNKDFGRDNLKSSLMQALTSVEMLGVDGRKMIKDKQVDCYLEFPSDWGLGSSSTYLNFMARYFGVDQYALLESTFGGSGYDLACAEAEGPLLYRKNRKAPPSVTPINWRPDWLRSTYFVHLNRKQNSREGIAAYRQAGLSGDNIAALSRISLALIEPKLDLRSAAQLLQSHERLIATALGMTPIQETFPDFNGTVKSLGAWGGDFVWVLSEDPVEMVKRYFSERGYGTFIAHQVMVL